LSKPPRTRTHASPPREKTDARPVSTPGDRHEREAERAAETVVRGGSVSSFSFSALPASSAPVQRQGDPPKSDDEKKKEALKKAGEAFLESKPGKELKEKVLADPVVKTVKDAVTSPAGLAVAGVGLAGGVGALAATHKPLPIQPPSIPLDKITPGLSASVKLEGPVDRPTFVGLTLTYKEQGPKGKKGQQKEDYAAETARIRAAQELFKPESQRLAEKQEEDAVVQAWVRSQNLTIPLTPGAKPKAEEPPKEEEKKEEEQAPVQRAPASTEHTSEAPAEAYVDDALASPGRALDPATRRSMEARFGYDFSGVRVHDDARAAATAAEIDAAAFTVGEDLVFGAGRFDPASGEGRRLLAHELAHVVQQSRGAPAGAGPVVQRRSIFESLGILLGIAEGTWEDRELHDYLDAIVKADAIEGAYDSDNKARAIVGRLKTSTPGYDLLPRQKILLIQEMLDGPTLGDDEERILDLLELSDASDLRAIFGANGISLTNLESDINGDNRTRLDAFVATRFDGGRAAVLAGRIEVVGAAVPTGAPTFGFDPTTLEARFDSDRTADDLIELVAAMPETGRAQALHHLVSVRRPSQLDEVERLRRAFRDETKPDRREAIKRVGLKAREAELKTERVIEHFFREDVPATEADLRNDTKPSDPKRQAEIKEALHPPTHVTAAGAATFRPTLPGESESYEDKVRKALPDIVKEAHKQLVEGRGPAEHATKAKTHELAEFEAIGNTAKDETDAVFGRFYSAADHPALTADRPDLGIRGNIHDQFAETERQLAAMTDDQRQTMAKQLVFYFFQSEDVIRRLNHDHDAAPKFDNDDNPVNDEAKALDRVATGFVAVTANVETLNDIDRNWPATARPETKEVFFQVFREKTPGADRLLLWDVFQTFIHEYLHTLAADGYKTFAESFGSSSNENNTLIEGVDSLLTETVWSGIEPRVGDKALREKVEGPANAALPAVRVPHASQRRYPSFTEALKLADLVGIRNVYAAYFLGLVDRIGGPAPAGAGP
jgi:hypothetical protein